MQSVSRESLPASRAIAGFAAHLDRSGLSATTIRIRLHFLTEYLLYIRQAEETADPPAAEFLSPERTAAWLAAAAAGRTRPPNTPPAPRGPRPPPPPRG